MAGIWVLAKGRHQPLELIGAARGIDGEIPAKVAAFVVNSESSHDYLIGGADKEATSFDKVDCVVLCCWFHGSRDSDYKSVFPTDF